MADFSKPVNAALIMDRSPPLGNSEGDDGRGRLHVKVSNKATEPIPVAVVDAELGQHKFLDYDNTPAGVGPHTLISYIVAAANRLNIQRLNISCRQEADVKVKLNGQTIATLRTGAANPSPSFIWTPARECTTGSLVEVILTKRAGAPDTTIGAHLMGVES